MERSRTSYKAQQTFPWQQIAAAKDISRDNTCLTVASLGDRHAGGAGDSGLQRRLEVESLGQLQLWLLLLLLQLGTIAHRSIGGVFVEVQTHQPPKPRTTLRSEFCDEMTAMESCKMAELRYEAPLATFDMDEWNEFLDEEADAESEDGAGGSIDDQPPHPEVSGGACAVLGGVGGGGGRVGCAVASRDSNFEDEETFTGSLEDLVNTFDDKIIKCFRNYGEQAEVIAPVQVRTQDDELQDTQ